MGTSGRAERCVRSEARATRWWMNSLIGRGRRVGAERVAGGEKGEFDAMVDGWGLGIAARGADASETEASDD